MSSDEAYYARIARERAAKKARRKEYEEGGELEFRQWCVARIHAGVTHDEFVAMQNDLIRRKRTKDWTIPDPEFVNGGEA